MKKIKELHPGEYYILGGQASANSSFIENEAEARIFGKYFKYYVSDFLYIQDFCVNQNGWKFAVKLKSKATITKRFYELRKGSRKKAWNVWRIISEQVRLTLSTFVRVINRLRNRTGSLVHSSYERYYLESPEEGLRQISEMRSNSLESVQREIRYKPLSSHYEIGATEETMSAWLSSGAYRLAKNIGSAYEMSTFSNLVLQKMIASTISKHRFQE